MNAYPVLESALKVPFKWSTGKYVNAFLTALRDQRQILGARCPGCQKVWVPPQSYCELCGGDAGELVPVADHGELVSWAVLHRRPPGTPENARAVALIRLAGADSDFLHLVAGENVRRGARVRAVWREQRVGSILDISHFAIEE